MDWTYRRGTRCVKIQYKKINVIKTEYNRKYNVKCTIYKAMCKGKGKGKTIPLQAWTGPEGSRSWRLPDFKTIDK